MQLGKAYISFIPLQTGVHDAGDPGSEGVNNIFQCIAKLIKLELGNIIQY
jgi:hypothetical protein